MLYACAGKKKMTERKKTASGDETESLTILFNVNAAGKVTPPLILFWYQRMQTHIAKNLPAGWSAELTGRDCGRLQTPFINTVRKIFYHIIMQPLNVAVFQL